MQAQAAPEPAPAQEEATPQPAELSSAEVAALEEKLAALKDKGNNQFRKKAYKEAVKHFSEAIKAFEDAGQPIAKGDVKTKITQIYTNRATSLHLLNQQSSVLSDTNFVIEKLDPTNKKALYRRAHAYQQQGLFEEAARDLQNMMKAHGEEDDVKAELSHCLKNIVTQKKKQAEEAKRKEEERKNRPKIQEIDVPDTKTKFKKIQIEEDSEDSDDMEEIKLQRQRSSEEARRRKQFD